MVEELNNSILASIGSAIAWIFTPTWLDPMQVKAGRCTAAITSFNCKRERCSNFRYVIWIRK